MARLLPKSITDLRKGPLGLVHTSDPQNNKTRRMTKYRVGRDSDESRIGKGKAEMRGQSLQNRLSRTQVKRNKGLA